MMGRIARAGALFWVIGVVACSSDGPPAGSGPGQGGGGGAGDAGGMGGSAGHGAGGIGGTSSAGGGTAGSGGGGAAGTGGHGGAAGAGGDISGAGGDGGTSGISSASGAGGASSTGTASGGAGGSGGSGGSCTGLETMFASEAISHLFGPGQSFGQDRFPAIAFGPPKGGGCCGGSTDVVSLGNGGTVTLGFSGNLIVDGPGPDFIVFENCFETGPTSVFAELATVEVSADGIDWVAFPCTAVAAPYGSCAGWHPVFANPDTNTLDPTDPSVAGGDAYDLADLGLNAARYVRITDRVDLLGPTGIFDLDGVAIANASCP